MSGTSRGGNTDLDTVFGGGGSAAPSGPSLASDGAEDYAPEPAEEDADAPPPEFATHAEEALDPEASPEDRIQALYRAIQACH